MLFFIAISLLLSSVSSTSEQPQGCPFPSGPYVPPECGKNEYFEVCSFKCPPQTCQSLWSKLPCDPGDGCCRNECRCIDGHFRNGDGECVPSQDCYQSSSQSSESDDSSSSASGGQASSSASAQSESSSSSQYRSSSQSSASAASSSSASEGQSSSSASAQAESSSSSKCTCKPQKPCIPTCAEPNPKNCKVDPKYICEGGYILSKKKGGRCIKIEECPKDLGCNGDKNAVVMSCPPPCPSTCDSPNQIQCKRACLAVGCACKPGFIASDKGCVKPECCPNGYPCPKNETFVNCKVGCPTNYCAVNDNQGFIICDPPYPCPSGCICKFNYRRKSVDDPQCILAEECRPVNCTRQNEEWSSCPSACLAEDCSDVDNQPTTCNTLVHNCSPRCICKKGYFRNQDRLCIPAKDCPK